MAASRSVRAALQGWPVALAAQLCALELGVTAEVSGSSSGAQSGLPKQGQWEAGHCWVPLWAMKEGRRVEALP
jgi:hypothetical protein